jgi:hypothetical protein
MSEMMTLSLVTRQFIHLLDGCLRGAEHAVELNPSHARPQITQEANADIVILPEHLRTKSLDDVSDQLLMPAAYQMSEELKEAKAAVIFNPPLPSIDGIEYSVHRYDGIAVRGMVQRSVEINGLIVDAFRFTVFYREAQLQ